MKIESFGCRGSNHAYVIYHSQMEEMPWAIEIILIPEELNTTQNWNFVEY